MHLEARNMAFYRCALTSNIQAQVSFAIFDELLNLLKWVTRGFFLHLLLLLPLALIPYRFRLDITGNSFGNLGEDGDAVFR